MAGPAAAHHHSPSFTGLFWHGRSAGRHVLPSLPATLAARAGPCHALLSSPPPLSTTPCHHPMQVIFPSFLSPAEVGHMVTVSRDHLERSEVHTLTCMCMFQLWELLEWRQRLGGRGVVVAAALPSLLRKLAAGGQHSLFALGGGQHLNQPELNMCLPCPRPTPLCPGACGGRQGDQVKCAHILRLLAPAGRRNRPHPGALSLLSFGQPQWCCTSMHVQAGCVHVAGMGVSIQPLHNLLPAY